MPPPLLDNDVAIAKMEDAMTRGRVFRFLKVDSLWESDNRRITWVLEEMSHYLQLQIFCERFRRGREHDEGSEGRRWPRLDGNADRRDLWWAAPSVATYVRRALPGPRVRVLVFTLQDARDNWEARAADEWPACGEMPVQLTLVCTMEARQVRPVGAHLTYEMVPENQYSTRWVPDTSTRISGLSCVLPRLEELDLWLFTQSPDQSMDEQRSRLGPYPVRKRRNFMQQLRDIVPAPSDDPGAPYDDSVRPPLFFATRQADSPGVEFAYANHDAALQHGDYRWMRNRGKQ